MKDRLEDEDTQGAVFLNSHSDVVWAEARSFVYLRVSFPLALTKMFLPPEAGQIFKIAYIHVWERTKAYIKEKSYLEDLFRHKGSEQVLWCSGQL